MQKRKKVWTKKRSPAVTIIACGIVLLFAIRLYEFFDPLIRNQVFKNGISGPLLEPGNFMPTPLGVALLSSTGYLLLSVAGLIVLIGFLRMHRWSWVVLMAWTGTSLMITLINYFYSHPNYLVMASNTIIAFALNQADVQRLFKIRTDQSEPIR
jgi:hypothetical protein